MYLQNIAAAHTQVLIDLSVNNAAIVYNLVNINTSSVADDNGNLLTPGARIIALNAGDFVGVQVTVSNSTKTVSVNGGANSAGIFEGFLVTSLGGVGSIIFNEDLGSAVPSGGALNVIGGTGITTSGSGNTITINATGSGFTWHDITGVSASMVPSNGYVADNAGLVTLTLPISANFGDTIFVVGKGAGGWTVAQNAGQSIVVEASATTVGAGGSISSTAVGQAVELLCTTANTTWTYINGVGTLAIV